MAASLPEQGQAMKQMAIIQAMVDTKLQNLKKLRKEESQSQYIQDEKNLLEGKLMTYFAKQLFLKIDSHIPPYQYGLQIYPDLHDLLYVVDVKDDMIKVILEKSQTVEQMCMFTDEKIRGIFYSHDDDNELAQILFAQYRRLCMALNILCSYVGRLLNGEKHGELHWQSWFDTLPESPSRDIRVPIANYLQEFNVPIEIRIGGAPTFQQPPSAKPLPPTTNIPRSQSDEMNAAADKIFIRRDKPRPGDIIISTTDEYDSDRSKSRSSSVSQSPRTPNATNNVILSMNYTHRHTIHHRFSSKQQLLISIACDHCHRLMFIGLKCKHCRFKCHKKCSAYVTPSCCLPEGLLKEFKEVQDPLKRTNSEPYDIKVQVPNSKERPENLSHGDLRGFIVKEPGGPIDSGSITSTGSSLSSSSPFPTDLPSPADINPADLKFVEDKFSYPDPENLLDTLVSTTSTIRSGESTDTYTNPEDSEQSKSSTEKSTTSTLSCPDEFNSMDNLNQQISDVVPNHVKLREAPLSRAEKHFQLSLLHVQGSLMSEWVIPYGEIVVGDPIGKGRVGEVFRARWHGEVALKKLYLEHPSSEEKNDFKYKVQILRRTRHENLILFMGACMEPTEMAIVCSFCKGDTLYTHIHEHKNTFQDAKIIDIVKQISHGMSYLHAKGIVHRDLKTKNIFLEGTNMNKIVITDFGLISQADVKVTNRKRRNQLLIPKGWLCYQAPEIIRKLDAGNPGIEVPYYTNHTDVYAFGSVWFELLAKQRPFHGHIPEYIIWQIGRGYKQPFSELEIMMGMKDIINMIWNFNPSERPSFHQILQAIEKIPLSTRRLIRSPSQPTYLTRYVNALI